jgi:hypothetical protein
MALKKANVALTQTITCLETYNVGRVLALKKASIVLKKTTYVALETSRAGLEKGKYCLEKDNVRRLGKKQLLALKKATAGLEKDNLEKGNCWA